MDNNDNERDELLKKFVESLKTPAVPTDFTEQELIEIFDYAGDLNNDFIRMEVLLRGARFFPESRELADRRGIIYDELLSQEDVDEFLKSSTPPGTFLGEITRVKLGYEQNDITDEEVVKFVNKSLEEFAPLQDEEIIRLVQLVTSVGKLPWLASIMEKVSKCVSNVDILCYEIAARSMESGDYAVAIPLLEKLVESFPYTDQYWAMLSQCQLQNHQFEAAEEALDMALAINPSNEMAVSMKLAFLPNDESARDALSSMYEHNPDNNDIFYRYVNFLSSYGDSNKARNMLLNRKEENPLEPRMLIAMMRLSPEDIVRYIKKCVPANLLKESTPDFWMELVYGAMNAHYFESAVALLIELFNKEKVEFSFDMLMAISDLLFKEQRFAEVLTVLLSEQNADLCDFTENRIIILVSLLKTMNVGHAADLARHWVNEENFEVIANFDSPRLLAEAAVGRIFRDVCKDIIAYDDGSNRFDIDKYDPLGLWK